MAVVIERCAKIPIATNLAEQVRTTSGSGWLKFDTEKAEYSFSRLGLAGRHQFENAKVAILLAEILQTDFRITTQDIIDGLQNARHPGRLEYDGHYLFDGAHNIGGVKALVAFLDEFETRPITMIFGAMKDKPIRNMLELLVPKVEKIILTQAANERSMKYDKLLDILGISKEKTFITDNVEKALILAETITREG